jgi:TatD DNase family protein
MIDTHMHFNDPTLYSIRDEVHLSAIKAGVTHFLVVGYDIESSKQATRIVEEYQDCYAIIGVHPSEVRGVTNKDYLWLEETAKSNPKVVAIGEIGFDLHWDTSFVEEQEEAFRIQLEIAIRVKKPVSIHARDASKRCFDVLKEYAPRLTGCVLHSYSGSVEMAKEYQKFGFLFGVSGPITYKNAKTNKEVVKELPLTSFLSETDSPYLPPTPHRGEKNEPKYIRLIVEEIAKIKGLSFEETDSVLEQNALRFFNLHS